MKAIWNNQILAESDNTIVVEGNHYFPENSINKEFFKPSETHTVCGWKGTASYDDVIVKGETELRQKLRRKCRIGDRQNSE